MPMSTGHCRLCGTGTGTVRDMGSSLRSGCQCRCLVFWVLDVRWGGADLQQTRASVCPIPVPACCQVPCLLGIIPCLLGIIPWQIPAPKRAAAEGWLHSAAEGPAGSHRNRPF